VIAGAVEVVSGRLFGLLVGTASLALWAGRRLSLVASWAPAAIGTETLEGWETEWVTTGALSESVPRTEATLAG
jgi:hypothetical protein